MKTFDESTKDFVCDQGCGTSIYNSTKEYTKCPECGKTMKDLRINKSKEII